MKLHLIILLTLIAFHANVFAQEKWVIKDMYIQAPSLDTLVVVGDCPSESHDSNRSYTALLSIGTYQSGLTFDLDTIQHKLRNVLVSSGYMGADGTQTTSFQFSSLDFSISSDTILKVNTNGSALINSLIGASFHIEGYTSYCTTVYRGHWWTRVDLVRLLDDTTQYNCSITLVIPQPVNIVTEGILSQKNLTVFSSLPDHTIHFSFPASDHTQWMTIYDILGREVFRLEIPAGSASYAMSSVGFPKGAFFARLGNSTAHFEVNCQ
jgi:hypothetical protein